METGKDVTRLLVVGGSAGGVDALQRFVAGLPADLPAAVLVTLHLGVGSPGLLADILARSCPLPVLTAEDRTPLRAGTVVVARSDAHLLVLDDEVRLGHGPRENHHRPSIDVLLRSAALARGSGVVGVVLTGMLDDGAAGLRRVARHAGAALVQHPDDAQFPSMPSAALAAVPLAAALPVAELAQEAVRLLRLAPPAPVQVGQDERDEDAAEVRSALGLPPLLPDGTLLGEPSPYSCPDCGGVLRQVGGHDHPRFRCRTGHAFNPETLLQGQTESVEEALYQALRALEERAELSSRLGDSAATSGRTHSRDHFLERADGARRAASVLRELLVQHRATAPVGEPVLAEQADAS